MIYVIGYTGLVGSAIHKYFLESNIAVKGVNSKNIENYNGEAISYLINANGSGDKTKAALNPKKDFNTLENLHT